VSGAAGRSAEVLRARGGVGVEVGTASRVWQSHIYKDVRGLAQAKGLPSLIYHEPVLEVRFMRGAAGTTRILTIRASTGEWGLKNPKYPGVGAGRGTLVLIQEGVYDFRYLRLPNLHR
jgi:hypothetical protein